MLTSKMDIYWPFTGESVDFLSFFANNKQKAVLETASDLKGGRVLFSLAWSSALDCIPSGVWMTEWKAYT